MGRLKSANIFYSVTQSPVYPQSINQPMNARNAEPKSANINNVLFNNSVIDKPTINEYPRRAPVLSLYFRLIFPQ